MAIINDILDFSKIEAGQMGMDGYLSKPVRMEDLRVALAGCDGWAAQ